MGRIKGKQGKFIGIGSSEIKTSVVKHLQTKPKKKYRVTIQERKSERCDEETMRSFMVYDFKGMSTIDSVKKKLEKSLK